MLLQESQKTDLSKGKKEHLVRKPSKLTLFLAHAGISVMTGTGHVKLNFQNAPYLKKAIN